MTACFERPNSLKAAAVSPGEAEQRTFRRKMAAFAAKCAEAWRKLHRVTAST
jgi:hypothetical protein